MATGKILIIYFFFILATCYGIEFSARSTNISIILLHFTQVAINKPIVLAPISIWCLMAGLSYGAVGDTQTEIFRAFAINSNRNKFNKEYEQFKNQVLNHDEGGVRAMNRNFYFVDNSLEASIENDFRYMLTYTYDTIFMPLDFQDSQSAAQEANAQIFKNASEVPGFFYPNTFVDSLILMSNVIYFKGFWSFRFEPSETKREKIGEHEVEMMYKRDKVPYSHIESMNATVMELTYGYSKKNYCMLVITPDDGVSVKTVYLTLDKVTFSDIFAKLQSDVDKFGLKEIDVKLPKFRKLSNLVLNEPLKDMGIYEAFEPEYARFDSMVNESIYIENIEQSASIMLTESGTVAYATTPVKVLEPFTEQVIPPCILFILEKTTRTVIFGAIFP